MSSVHTDDTRRRAVDLYLQKDRSVDDIAAAVGASRSTVYAWLQAAGVTGGRQTRTTRASRGDAATTAEIRDQIADVLDNQLRFAMDIDRMTTALDALRTEQTSSAGGWMEQIREARHNLDVLNATVARLTGAVETLVAMQHPAPSARQSGVA